MIKLTLILFATIFTDSTDNLEQKATDYFFDNIFKSDYQDYKVVEFKNQTDTSKYYGIIHKCEIWDKDLKYLIMSIEPGQTPDVKANVKDIKIKNLKMNSGRLKVYVYSKVKVSDNYFVSIATYKKLHFANYYFIKFDRDGNIIETCKTGEII